MPSRRNVLVCISLVAAIAGGAAACDDDASGNSADAGADAPGAAQCSPGENTSRCQGGLTISCYCGDDGTWACIDGIPFCPITCEYGGTSKSEGQTFPSTDGCNTCTCSQGHVSCTKRACAPDSGVDAGENDAGEDAQDAGDQ